MVPCISDILMFYYCSFYCSHRYRYLLIYLFCLSFAFHNSYCCVHFVIKKKTIRFFHNMFYCLLFEVPYMHARIPYNCFSEDFHRTIVCIYWNYVGFTKLWFAICKHIFVTVHIEFAVVFFVSDLCGTRVFRKNYQTNKTHSQTHADVCCHSTRTNRVPLIGSFRSVTVRMRF
jgi:hypothetical protein